MTDAFGVVREYADAEARTFGRLIELTKEFKAISATKISLNTRSIEAADRLRDLLTEYVETGPFNAEFANWLAQLTNGAPEVNMRDWMPALTPKFPAEELRKLYDLVDNDPIFKREIGSIPLTVDIVRKMSDEQLVVMAERCSVAAVDTLYANMPGSFGRQAIPQIVLQATKRALREKEESEQASKRVKLPEIAAQTDEQ